MTPGRRDALDPLRYTAAVRAQILSAFLIGSCWFSAARAAPPPAIERVVLRSSAIAAESLRTELALRRPEASIVDFDDEGAGWSRAEAWMLVIVERSASGFAVSVILSDGRAYDRVVEAQAAQEARAVASALANLLAAISEDRVAPDREAVTIESLAPTTREPAAAGAPEVVVDLSQQVASDVATPPPEGGAMRPVKLPNPWSIGPRIGGAALVGVGPPRESGALLGGGGALGISARSPSGATLAVDLRLLHRAAGEFTLSRVKVSLGAGYGLERGRFGLDLAGFMGIEGWSVRAMGEQVAVLGGVEEAPAAALGAGVRVVPALLLPLEAARRLSLGLAGEIGYGGVIDGGLRAARLSVMTGAGEDAALFRVGGVELSLGLELGLRFDVKGRR